MSDDINTKILAAFQAEHKEHLEGIRGLLAKMVRPECDEKSQCLDEAFRMAHSLKGGARVCDLRPVEALAHRLETVFEQVRSGGRILDDGVVRTIGIVLDAIEDWMAEIDCDDRTVDPADALTAIERLLGTVEDDSNSQPPLAADDDPAQRILAAFHAECPKYVAELRRLLGTLAADGPTPADVDEAYRVAHNLRGSADAAEVTSIERLGADLEALIDGFRDSPTSVDADDCDLVGEMLDAVECELTPSSMSSVWPGLERSPLLQNQDGPVTHAHNSRVGAVSPRSTETVRVSIESLDRIQRSSAQLLAQHQFQEQMGRELNAVRRQIADMDREREAVRRVTAANLHRLTAVPEFNHLVRYLDSIDRGIHWLTRRTRGLCMEHKRHALKLETCGRSFQQDVKHARMVPAEAVYPGLRKTVRDLAGEEGKQVELTIVGFDVRADRMVFQALKDPLIHMLRNCISHGIESPEERAATGKAAVGRVGVRIETIGNRLVITVEDDGRGIDARQIAARAVKRGLLTEAELAEQTDADIESLIFQPGFSTSAIVTEIAGRGMGLSVVQQAAVRLQGEVDVHRNDAGGTTFRLSVPLTVSTHRLLLVSASDGTYAVPILAVERLLRVNVDEFETIEGKPVITFRDQPVPLVSLAHLLGQNGEALTSTGRILHVAVLKTGSRHLAVSVDAFLAERELLVHDLDEFAARPEYFGAALLNDGAVSLVLNPVELLQQFRPAVHRFVVADVTPKVEKRTPRVLVVDDSFTTRTLEKSILEANGYEVAIAVDGVEGMSRLKSEPFDMVISDIEMPRMDGFTLLEAIKQDRRLSSTPVILVTSRDRPEDRERGLDLGADAYIVKQRFDHQSLLQVIRQIVDW